MNNLEHLIDRIGADLLGWATEIPPSDMRAHRAVLDGYARPEGRASQGVNVTLTILRA